MMVAMIAEDPSYYLTRTSFVVHWTIKFIYIPRDVATGSNLAWSRATKKPPPPIFMMVAMVAGYSTNVVVWRALKIHWLVKLVNISHPGAPWIAMIHNLSALPTPNSVVSMMVAVHT